MPRTSPPAGKAATAKYAPILANPLDPLAEQVGKAVAREVTALGRAAPALAKGAAVRVIKSGEPSAAALETRLTHLVTEVLEESLNSQTADGRALRLALIAKLANAEAGCVAAGTAPESAPDDSLLTTADAAIRLEVSRPYVSMLCDSGKLGEVVMTEGGHRRIRASAIKAYLAARTKQYGRAASPRQAGVEAGLYDHPESHAKVVRGQEPAKKAAPAKVARKSRS